MQGKLVLRKWGHEPLCWTSMYHVHDILSNFHATKKTHKDVDHWLLWYMWSCLVKQVTEKKQRKLKFLVHFIYYISFDSEKRVTPLWAYVRSPYSNGIKALFASLVSPSIFHNKSSIPPTIKHYHWLHPLHKLHPKFLAFSFWLFCIRVLP